MQMTFEKIYAVVRRIPRGKVATYGQIAILAGNPRGARTVGWALHGNPDPEGIPCYRVVDRNGRVSDAFVFGGRNVQIDLLQADGIPCTDGCVDLKKYLWDPAGYRFYGWEDADVPPVSAAYSAVKNPRVLYDLLSEIWCADTCAPRMRQEWTPADRTLGQCSITAFLAQDIFGGEVHGILRPGGNYHCFNVAGDCVFDLTSEQFGDEMLVYENQPLQQREVHFAKAEKYQRYLYLKGALEKKLCSR